jgi:hypothetical protein
MEAACARTSLDHALIVFAGAADIGMGRAVHEHARSHAVIPWRRKSVKPRPLTRLAPLSTSARNCS